LVEREYAQELAFYRYSFDTHNIVKTTTFIPCYTHTYTNTPTYSEGRRDKTHEPKPDKLKVVEKQERATLEAIAESLDGHGGVNNNNNKT